MEWEASKTPDSVSLSYPAHTNAAPAHLGEFALQVQAATGRNSEREALSSWTMVHLLTGLGELVT